MEIRRGDVFWADMPRREKEKNVQLGRRPVIVVSNNKNNKYSGTVIVIPLSTRIHKSGPKYPFHVLIESVLHRESIVLTEQMLVMSKESLLGKPIAIMPQEDMKRINKAIKLQLSLD